MERKPYREFLKLLRKHGCLRAFRKYYRKDRLYHRGITPKPLPEFFDSEEKYIPLVAFKWNQTRHGSEFWMKIQTEWNVIHESLKTTED